ncbi:MAG: DUF72 domain-containing protein [Gemmatimonadales bacterium]
MQLLVGMSGFAYKAWKGGFYPEDLPADGMLGYYAGRFPAVEINNTFYRMPSEKVLLQWADQVPEQFVFALKASRRITHLGRLKNVEDSVEYFLRTASVLENRLGPTLFQLPPNFKKDLPLLQAFLALLPRRWLSAFEFRHDSWFDDGVYQALAEREAALCVAEDDKGATPMVRTAGWGYLRLRRSEYGPADLQAWTARLSDQRWERAFVFFKHEEDGGLGPAAALAYAGEAAPRLAGKA